MTYTIKLAEISELPLIQSFIDNHWKKGHALAKSTELIKFQHLNSINDNYNYIIALNNHTNEIDALLGFIPSYQYDKKLYENGDYWGAIWKVRSDVKNDEIKDIGIYLWSFLRQFENFQSWAAIGISKIAKKIYKLLDMRVGTLFQYYYANPFISNFQIAEHPIVPAILDTPQNCDFLIQEIDITKINGTVECCYKPAKTISYLINRYAKHPIYQYSFWGIFQNEKLVAIWTIRIIQVNQSKVIRLVDVLGKIEELPNLAFQIQTKLNEAKAEYIDFLNFGIDSNAIKRIGFEQLDFEGDSIIPNYFEPFEKKNVPIEFAYLANYPYTIFKADSDQDRPNIL